MVVDVKRVMGIVLFFLFLIFSANAIAYSELEIYQDRCYPDGSLSFTVANDKTDVLNISETNLLVQNAYIRNITFVPTGRWNQSITYYNLTEGKMYSSTFVGDENQITESGDYHLFVRYVGCREGQCKAGGYLKNCLAHSGDCYKYKPVVYGCTVDPVQKMAFIQFGGEKNKYFGEVDPARDLLFFITSDTRNLEGVRRVEGASFSKQGDVREMRFPLLKNEVLTDVAIVHTRCNSPFQQQQKMACVTGERGQKRGIGNALTEEMVSVNTPPAAGALPPKPTIESDIVDTIIQQKEQETQQRIDEVQQELDQTKEELDAYKQMQENQQAEPLLEVVPDITGAVTGSANPSTGVPAHFMVLVVLVVAGVVLLIATNVYTKKKKETKRKQKEEEERKEKNFGFGD